MKRNILITLLIIVIMALLTACGNSSNSDASKFEGTWVAYVESGETDDEKAKGDKVFELTVAALPKGAIVSSYIYKYEPLFTDFGKARNISNKEFNVFDRNHYRGPIPANVDFLLEKEIDLHNEIASIVNNELIVEEKSRINKKKLVLIYNEKDETLIFDKLVLHKKSDNNSITAFAPKMEASLKTYYNNYIKTKRNDGFNPISTVDYYFDNSLLESTK